MDALANVVMLGAIAWAVPTLALLLAGWRAVSIPADDEPVSEAMVWEYVCATCHTHEGRTDAQWGAPCARCGQTGESA